MNAAASWMLWELARTTLLVAVLGVAAWLVLRLARIGSPALHRAGCVAVLLAGWTFVRWPVEVAWYEAPETPVIEQTAVPVEAPQGFSPPIDPALLSPPPELGAPMSLSPQMPMEPPAETPPSEPPTRVVPTPGAALPANWQLTWQPLAIGGWIVGIVAIVSAWIVGYLRFLRRLPAEVGTDAEWAAEFAAVRAEQGGAGDVTLRVTESAGPLLCRIPRGAMLLVPRSMWIALAPHERRAILRHELAHYRRGDLWKSLAVRVLALPHWFNPIAWLAVRRFDDAAEWACDRAAMGDEPTTYAAMLLRLGELASTPARFGSAMSKRPLHARIRRLLTLSVAEDSAMKKATLISLLILVLPLALVRVILVAEEPEVNPFADPPQHAANLEAPVDGPPPLEDPSAAEPPAANLASPDDDRAEPPRAAPTESPVRTAQRKMLEMAKKTYTVNWESAKAGHAVFDLDEAVRWSNLWLSAELALAKSRAEQLAAARAHLERIKVVEAGVRSLHERALKGGETVRLSAANYHLADAERRLAEIEAMPEPAAQAAPAQADRKMVETAKRAFKATDQAYHAGLATLDALIDWSFKWLAADLAVAKSRGEQLAAAQANVERIRKLHTGIAALYTTGSRGGDPQAMETANYYLADAERRLAEIEAAPVGSGLVSRRQGVVTFPSEDERKQLLDPADKPQSPPDKDLRFDGKTFDQWLHELRTELSLKRRTEAMQAMGAFAANGYGKQVAKATFEVMQGYSTYTMFDGPESQLKEAAVSAAQRVPAAELLPEIRSAMAADNVNARLFAMRVVPTDEPKDRLVPLLVATLQDSNPQVAALARTNLAYVDHANPTVVAWLRKSLGSGQIEEIEEALPIVCGYAMTTAPGGKRVSPNLDLIPSVVSLLDAEDPAIRASAHFALLNMGSSLLEPLGEILSSGKASDAVRKMYEEIEAKGNRPIGESRYPNR